MPPSAPRKVERLCLMKCPCGLDLEMPVEWVGTEVLCPRCRRPMVVTPEAAREARQVTVPAKRRRG